MSNQDKIKELFDLVYGWGYKGIVVTPDNKIFRKELQAIINSNQRYEI